MTAQTNIPFGKELKEKGIKKATDHAELVHDGWNKTADYFFKYFVTHSKNPFKMEDFREWVKGMLPSPPSLRAFGGVTVRAVRAGLIEKVGYAQVTNAKAHRANCSLWKRR